VQLINKNTYIKVITLFQLTIKTSISLSYRFGKRGGASRLSLDGDFYGVDSSEHNQESQIGLG